MSTRLSGKGICGTPYTIDWVVAQIAKKTGIKHPLAAHDVTPIGIGLKSTQITLFP